MSVDSVYRDQHLSTKSKQDPEERRRAARYVASSARDAVDCAFLLAVLGLDPAEGRSP